MAGRKPLPTPEAGQGHGPTAPHEQSRAKAGGGSLRRRIILMGGKQSLQMAEVARHMAS